MRIQTEDAARKLKDLAAIAAGQSQLPATSCIRLELTGPQQVTATATDLSQSLTVDINGEGEVGEAVLLPAGALLQIVANLGGDAIITPEGSKATVSSEDGQNRYTLLTLPVDDFPDFDGTPVTDFWEVEASELAAMFAACNFAIAKKDHRRVLMGAFLAFEDGKATLTTTDGKQLAQWTIATTFEGNGGVVPASVCAQLAKLTGSGTVKVGFGVSAIEIVTEGYRLRSQLIDGKYPDCTAVIPKDRPIKLHGNAKEILLSIRRAGILTDDKNKCVIFDIKAQGQSMVTAMSHDKGAYSGKLPIKSEVDIQAAFNVEFLAEMLKNHGERDVRIEAKSATAPWCFFFAGADPGLFLLMPVKLSDIMPTAENKSSND